MIYYAMLFLPIGRFFVLKQNYSQMNKIIKKRQWGTEKDMTLLSIFHEKPSTGKIALSRIAIVLTVFFWLAYVSSTIFRQFIEGSKGYDFTMEAFGYLIVVTVLSFSALMYLIMRQGAFQRFAKHTRVSRALIDKFFARKKPAITVLVPSYAEEPQVIRKTLLSAALQEYPKKRIVLLIDDNPNPKTSDELDKLNITRNLADEIKNFLAEPYKLFSATLARFEKQNKNKKFISGSTIEDLSECYLAAGEWLVKKALAEEISDHVDIFFTEQVLKGLADDLNLIGEALKVSVKEDAKLSYDRVHQLFQRLVWIFDAKIETFERKKYASLSHEPNKAMNLNSYIGLMGGTYRFEDTPEGTILLPVDKSGKDTITIPDSEFLLTLDADSILLREYCLRLVYLLEQPDNSNVAVSQTPYSSFRGAPTRIEKLAGATTDVQHILHQGMTHYNATFWVGANAVIRKKALLDICEKEWVGGFEIKRFIQDHTVIEDTESSVDLALHGWKLINYPERLSYSATPPDFGSLIVQRRRWANGGLLILSKLWSHIRAGKRRNDPVTLAEICLRVNYMASIAWASFGLVFLLAFPYDGRLLSPLVLLSALPYFLAMAVDLKYCGYSYSDIFRIYGFNLILLPVNLAGVLKSIEQALTNKKIPFARTPKIKDRTIASLPYIIAPLLIIGFSIFTLWRNINEQNWGNAAFAGFNALTAAWAVVAYIGLGNLIVDLWVGATSWMYVEVKPKAEKLPSIKPALDWKDVLYHGEKTNLSSNKFNSVLSELL